MTESELAVESLLVRIEDLTGARHVEASVAPDAPVATSYGPLATRFGYESGASTGVTFGLALFHRRTGTLLTPEATFAAAEVRSGDTLVLVPTAVGEDGR